MNPKKEIIEGYELYGQTMNHSKNPYYDQYMKF